MTNLTEKFTAFEQQTAAQHAELLLALNAVATSLASVDTSLARIRDAVWPVTDPEITDDRASLRWAMYRLMDATAPAWPRPTSAPVQPGIELLRAQLNSAIGINLAGTQGTLMALLAQIINNVGIPTGDATTTVLGRLAAIETSNLELVDNVGIPTGDATTTVLGRLATIENYSKCFCGPQLPSTSDPAGCTNPWLSSSVALASGRNYAVWPAPARAGVAFTTALGVGVANAEISPTLTWNGIKLYVYSKKASYYMDAPLSGVLRPTNTWRALTGNSPMAISVPDGSDIQVLLCTDGVETCETIGSRQSTASGGFNGTVNALAAPPAGMAFVNPVGSSSGNVTWTPAAFISGNLTGYTLQVLSGGVRVVYRSGATNGTGAFSVAGNYNSGNGIVNLPACTHFSIDDAGQFGPFSVKICPPQPS